MTMCIGEVHKLARAAAHNAQIVRAFRRIGATARALPRKTVAIEAALWLLLLIMELVVTCAEQLSQMNAELMRGKEELDACLA